MPADRRLDDAVSGTARAASGGRRPSSASVDDRPVYVTGMMESGKSTLVSLLDGHPELLAYPQEPQFGRMLEAHYATAEEARAGFLDLSPLSRHGRLLGIEDRQDSVFDRARYRAALETALARDFSARGVMIATMRAFAAATGQDLETRARWVFNEPNRARLVPWFFATFPEGRVVHLLRDPRAHFRAVLAHHARAGRPMGRLPALSFSMDWALGAAQAFENRARFGARRYLALRFEDLCSGREQAMRGVADFLGIDFAPALLRPSKVGLAAEGERIAESDIGDWLRPLSARERLVVECCCADLMAYPDLRYRPEASAPLLRLAGGILSRAVHGAYYGRRLVKGLAAPPPLHDLYRVDRAATDPRSFRP